MPYSTLCQQVSIKIMLLREQSIKKVFIYASNHLNHTRKGNMLLCVVNMCEVFVKLFMIAVIVET